MRPLLECKDLSISEATMRAKKKWRTGTMSAMTMSQTTTLAVKNALCTLLKMVPSTKASGKDRCAMAKEFRYGLMVPSTKATG